MQSAQCKMPIHRTENVAGRVLFVSRLLHVALQQLSMLSNSSTASSPGSGLKPSRRPTWRRSSSSVWSRRDRRRCRRPCSRSIDRQLVLKEVARFPPAEPPAARSREAACAMKARAGDRFDRCCRSPVSTRCAARAGARHASDPGLPRSSGSASPRRSATKRRGSITRRIATSSRRNGMPLPFEEAEADARQRAAADALQRAVAQWLQDLRARSDVVIKSLARSAQPAAPRAS